MQKCSKLEHYMYHNGTVCIRIEQLRNYWCDQNDTIV